MLFVYTEVFFFESKAFLWQSIFNPMLAFPFVQLVFPLLLFYL
jgi:hypothetical protein